MKKLMIAAVATAGLAAFGIESANTVGYNTDTITAKKFNMVSVPFEGTDGDGFKINQCLSGVDLTGTDSPTTADQIQFWDAATGAYENWYYYEAGDEWTGWWDAATAMKMFEEVYPNGLPAGTAFWYKSAAGTTKNGSVVVAGQVPTAASVDFEIMKGKFNMVAYPYPVAFKLNDTTKVSWANAHGTADWDNAAVVQEGTWSVASSKGTTNAKVSGTYTGTGPEGLANGNMYGVMVQDDQGGLHKVTGTTTYTVSGYSGDNWSGETFTFATSSYVADKASYPAGGDVPEPTSGLLLVVGGAMLALRRKQK